VAEVTQLDGLRAQARLRTGTVASTDNRNWELLPDNSPQRRFSQSRAVALDMESATIAANGFRFRVPYGTLLCVSDKPLHGEIKLPGMANHFYRERVDQHLLIGMRAIERLREAGWTACTAASCAALPKWRSSRSGAMVAAVQRPAAHALVTRPCRPTPVRSAQAALQQARAQVDVQRCRPAAQPGRLQPRRSAAGHRQHGQQLSGGP
jgi:hypothetical protein